MLPCQLEMLTEELEREERRYEAELAAVRGAVDEGDASGIAEGDVFARVRTTLNLPTAER